MSGSFSQYRATRFHHLKDQLTYQLIHRGDPVDSGRWQSVDVSERPEMVSVELANVSLLLPIQTEVEDWQTNVAPNMPWAEAHFLERVGGHPLNPPPSHELWPFARHNNANQQFIRGGKFSHTYPERFWPKHAGHVENMRLGGVHWSCGSDYRAEDGITEGIRFPYGDLEDVYRLMLREPLTRQAYLPVWFPEDTGAIHGERVPCTLGYHFLMRHGIFHVTYHIRSCDFVRHFADDVYLAGRLAHWFCQRRAAEISEGGPNDQVPELWTPGLLTMHVGSLHCFQGDMPLLRKKVI